MKKNKSLEGAAASEPKVKQGLLFEEMKECAITVGQSDLRPQTIGSYQVHPAANVLPMLDGEEFQNLVDSIRQYGQLHPVDVDGNVLLKGRNRARAIEMLKAEGVDISLKTVERKPIRGGTHAEFIKICHLLHRHMTVDQRAMAAAQFVKQIENERRERQKQTRFQPGHKAGKQRKQPAGDATPKAASVAAGMKPYPPKPAIDAAAKKAANKEKLERSTRGEVASRAKVSHHKADQAVRVSKQASKAAQDEVLSGAKTLAQALKDLPAADGSGGKKKRAAPAKKRPVSSHPYQPTGGLDADCLKFWEAFVDETIGVADRPRARQIFRDIFQAEERQEELLKSARRLRTMKSTKEPQLTPAPDVDATSKKGVGKAMKAKNEKAA